MLLYSYQEIHLARYRQLPEESNIQLLFKEALTAKDNYFCFRFIKF